ncbi:MAG TPA: phasin family protein [Dokdonella sp.]
MNFDTQTPMALYKANLDLMLRIAALMQQSRRDWLEAGTRSAGDSISRTLGEADRAIAAGDWNTLVTLPAEAWWQGLQRGVGDLQNVAENALGNQARFAEGIRQALADWQQRCTEALQTAGANSQAGNALQDLLNTFAAFRVPTAAATPGPAAPEAAAEKPKPGRK